jgi:ribonuclease HII
MQLDALPLHHAGADEAGRGPLAGPVVCAAVMLDPKHAIAGLKDSKMLTSAERDALAAQIRAQALSFAIIEISPTEIDRLNILQASLLGMAQAIAALKPQPSLALIDGNRLPKLICCPARAVVRGDALIPAISAASILAKTHRDALMLALDARYPEYQFAQHKGYPTPQHLALLQRFGPCPAHRRSFAPVHKLMQSSLLNPLAD